ncbi:Aminomethyltransferase [Dactylellina cionopaga]|nr:Aminomethyltransferase [Dactylellina cionopaga]
MASRVFGGSRRAIGLMRQYSIQQRAITTLPRLQRPAAPLPLQAISRGVQCVRTIPACSARYAYSTSTSSEALQRTPLYDLHIDNGGEMVEFGGYEMPVKYKDQTIGDSHNYVRDNCGLFDVSHMVQHQFTGPTAALFLESVTPSDLKSLAPFSSTLSVLLLPTGGILDDTVITKHDDNAFYVVTNAGCREKDLKFISEELSRWNSALKDSEIVRHDVINHGLVALQGPKAQDVLQSLLPQGEESLSNLYFGQSRFATLKIDNADVRVHIARGGYTGEDGFEISIPKENTHTVSQALLDAGNSVTKLIGLGARDSLRLEAGMCLYGHDLDEATTPVEGALTWVIAKSRRENKNFPGAQKILAQIKEKPEKRRVGLIIKGAPAREGAIIKNKEGNQIGSITSGCPSPTLKQNIAMGYVEEKYKKVGTEVDVIVRGKTRQAVIAKMPFVPSKYHKEGGGKSNS